MWSDLKYQKTEIDVGVFSTCIVGKKNGNPCAVPIEEKNNDYVNIKKLVDAGELTIASTGGKYLALDMTEKDES
tara:strand:+ start:1020 stop:1241 length:222 start_codon:yes stop_codon:yes gene_type:complete